MEAERTKILEMLREGQLTVEQASQLLDALAQSQKAESKSAPEPEAEPEPEADWGDFRTHMKMNMRGLGEHIRSSIHQAFGGLSGIGRPGARGGANFSTATLTRAALERLADGSSYTNFGSLTIADDVPEDLLSAKIANCTNFGSIQGPPHLVQLLQERCSLNFGGFRTRETPSADRPAASPPSEPGEEVVLTGQNLGGWQDWPVRLQYQELFVKCHAGNVVVEGTEEPTLQLTVSRPATLGAQENWVDRIRFAPRLEDRKLVFEIGDPRHPGNTANHTFRFGVPTDLADLALQTGHDAAINVTVDTSAGHLTASSLPGWVSLRTGGGDITCTDIASNAALNTGGGNLQVNDISGNVTLQTGGGNLAANDVSGNLTANTGGGNIELEDIAGNVVANTGGGEVELQDIAGNASASTGAGDIKAEDISGNLNAKTGAGDVTASDVRGDVEVKTGAGDVEVHDVSGNVIAKTTAGDLHIHDVEGDVTFEAAHGAIDVTDVRGSVRRG